MTVIDSTSTRTVNIVRRSPTKDADGNPTVAETTIESSKIADIQPLTGGVMDFGTGKVKNYDHKMFTRDYLTGGAQEHDIVVDGTTEYEIMEIQDWRDHREYRIKRL